MRTKCLQRFLHALAPLMFFLTQNLNGFAQDPLQILRFDDRHLVAWPGTSVVNDATAHRGTAFFRPASAPTETFWFGPYYHFQAGNYLVQFRLKVASNSSSSDVLNLNIVSDNGVVHCGLILKPNMFRASNEWQLFTLPIQVPENVVYLEIRGLNFISGVTDMYMDYITVLPGDLRGNYSPEFTVDGKGDVGIGTVSPSEKLAVNGNIRAKEIKVEAANWPDYVFGKNYKLRPLSETEKHIKEKGHLPGIPSAAVVADKGVELGEMNKKLLEKIEELTLHLIRQQKQLYDQQKQINQLKNRKNNHFNKPLTKQI